MATTAQIIDQVIRRLNELSTANPVHWARADLLEYLSDAVNELNLIAAEIQRTDPVATTIGVNVFGLASDVIAPFAIRVDGYYLLKQPVIELDNEADWEGPLEIRKNIKVWSPLGLGKVIIWPRPIVQPTQLDVEELVQHQPIVDGAVNLQIRPEYETAIEDYMVHRAMFREAGPELDQMEPFFARFLDAAQQLSGRNILRRYPAWDVEPETKVSETTMTSGLESGSKK